MAEFGAAESIRNILAGAQASSTTYLFSSAEKGSGYSAGDFLRDLAGNAIGELLPVLGMFLGVFGSGGGGDDTTRNSSSSSGETQGYVFRKDKRPSKEMFKKGFQAWNLTGDTSSKGLESHVFSTSKDSAFVATSSDAKVAKSFKGDGWVYIIKVPDYADTIYGDNHRYARQKEIAFPREIPASWIIGAKKVQNKRFQERISFPRR
jgi:hypothetical protein